MEENHIPTNTVELQAEADVSPLNAHERVMVERVARLSEQNFRTFVAKNIDYGASYRTTGRVESELTDGLFEDPLKANAYHILVRLMDKRHRLYRQLFGDGGDNVNESTVETALDAANYYLMLAALLEAETDD
jgi:hypothetical protein